MTFRSKSVQRLLKYHRTKANSLRSGQARRRRLFETLEGRRLLALSDFVINEVLADPAADLPGDANGDGTRSEREDEFIELVNTGQETADIGGWTISDEFGLRHTFPSPTNVAAGQAVLIFGGGAPSGTFGGAEVQVASEGSLGLNNGGDTVTLDDGGGGTPVTFSYGGDGGDNQSLTRSPDLTGAFTKHSSLGSLLFSPGFETDGTTSLSSGGSGGTPTPTVTLNQSGGSTTVSEDGDTDTLSLFFGATPTDDITVTLTPADNEVDLGAGAGNDTTLIFTPTNANTPQSVTVSAIDDTVDEGPHSSSISFTISSGDADFDSLALLDVTVSIEDNDAVVTPPPSGVVINELDPNQPSTDTAEFIELYDGGVGSTVLDGLVVVLFNGNGDVSYDAIDLDGFSTDADGFFVLDSSNMGGGTSNLIQNGTDAVALYAGNESDFPSGTPVTSTNLLDSIVYGSSTDDGLLSVLGGTQQNDTATESISRSPDGSSTFVLVTPTAGGPNAMVAIDPEINITRDGSTVAISDTVDFGSFVQNDPASTLTFTIENSGNGDLTLGTITVGTGNFSVTQPTSSTVAPTETGTFTVTFTPSTVVDQTVTVTVPSDDADEPSYTFSVSASVTAVSAPEITVAGNSIDIVDGTATVNTADGTDFGSVDVDGDTAISTFSIANAGTADLDISDVAITGTNAADFSISGTTSTNLSPSGTATFDVTYDPSTIGVSDATVVISSTDDDEASFDFAIQGSGITVARNIVINEIDSDTADENDEFIELFDGGSGNTALDGLVLVLFNGNGGVSYAAFDLDGFSTDADGFFIIGDSDVPSVDFVPPGFDDPSPASPASDIQNGEDAVALFVGNASDFPNGTIARSSSILDALVYETGADSNSDLPALLGAGGAVDEAANQEKDTDSISRGASGSFGAGTPTPGAANIEPPIPPGKLSVRDETLNEFETFGTVLIILSEPQAGSVVVTATAIDGTATADDYSIFSNRITFFAGETLKSLPVSIINDNLAEGAETFTVELSNPSGATIEDGTAVVTIIDDEPPTLSIGDVSVSESAGTADFTVSLSSPAEFGFTVDVNTVDGTATSPADFTSVSSQVSFGIGESEKTVSVPIIDDATEELVETFEVIISNPPLVISIADDTAVGTIQSSDRPVSTNIVINEFDSDTVDESSEFIELYDGGVGNTPLDGLVVVLFNGNGEVSYDAFDLDGFSTDANGFFVIGDGDVSGVDLVPTEFDAAGATTFGSDIQNGEDAIAVYVGDATDFLAGTVATTTNLLDAVVYETGPDTDSGLPGLLGLVGVVDEDATGDRNGLGLSRSPDGTGDFVPLSVTPNADNTVPVVLTPDITAAGNGIVIVSGDETPDSNDGTDFGAFITGADSATQTFAITNEGDGPLTITDVSLSVASGDSDFALTPPASLSIAAGSTESFEITLTPTTVGSQVATVTITSDDADEATYTFTISAEVTEIPPTPIEIWLNEIHYDNVGTDANENIEIAGAAGVDVTGASIVLYNGSNGLAYDTIALSGVIDDEGEGVGALGFEAVGIQNGPDGIALVNTDGSLIEFVSYEGVFEALDGPANGTTSVDIGVEEPGEEPGEEDESLQRLDNVSGGDWSGPLPASPGTLNTAPVIPDPTLLIAALDVEQPEGDTETTEFTFEVTRDGDLSGQSDVEYAVSSSEADADDFGGILPSGTVTFAADETTKTITVAVSGDLDVETDESFTVTLGNPSGTATITTGTATGTIQNDDVLIPDFAIAAVDAELAEGDSASTDFTFEVTRTGDLSIPESIDYVVSGEADATDFGGSLPSGTVAFAAAEATQIITIAVSDDDVVETDEAFTVTLSNASNSGTISVASADGLIQNDDVVIPDFAIAAANASQPEGDSGSTDFTFEVTRTGDLSIVETVAFAVTSSEADSTDFGGSLPGGTVSFAIDVASLLITISVSGDEVVEADEAFTITLSNASNSGMISVASADGLIQNDDVTPDPVVPDPVDPPVDSIEIDKYLWDINGRPALHNNLSVGDELIYSFDITNTGNTILTNVVVSDPLPGLVFDQEVIEAYIAHDQPAVTPASGDVGPFASVDRELGSDPAETKAWENFTLGRGTVIDGLSWTGAYVEPFATGSTAFVPETDFLIEVFADDAGTPGDVMHSFKINGGEAGISDADVTSTLVPGVTATDGGPVYEYSTMLPFTYLLPGDYWISIAAQQTFPNPKPTIDPTWQWHLAGEGDGFFTYDDLFDDVGDGTPVPALFSATKDLAFTLHAARLVDDFNDTLEPGETVMFMGTYYVTQDDLDAGVIVNTGTVTANGEGGSVSDSDEFIWATLSAKLSITTLANDTDVSAPVALQVGAALTWTYEVTNTGNVDLTNVEVTDQATVLTQATNGNGDGVLSPGETWQYTSNTSSTELGLQRNIGVATAESALGEATDTDLGYYVGQCIPQQHADMNGDGRIAFQDFLNFRVNFGQEASGPVAGDFDCNGVVEFADFLVLSEQYGRSLDELFASDELDEIVRDIQLAVSPGRRNRG